MRIHLDTDFGGDPDDACALAMLLGWPGVELVGITTTIDADGFRAAGVAHCLRLAGRDDVPIAVGASVSITTKRRADPFRDERYWPAPLTPYHSPPGAALDLLARSVEAGATIVAIGPLTNLALLEMARPGVLDRASVVFMGGWLRPPDPGFPAWGPEMDFNVQWDTRAAEIVASATRLTLCPLSVAMPAPLRAEDLPRLGASGPLGALLARQSAIYGQESGMSALGRAHTGWPDDLVNVLWDPVACAAALGWDGVVAEEMQLAPARDGSVLLFRPSSHGRLTRVATTVDGARFAETWLAAVEGVQPPNSVSGAIEQRSPRD